MTRITMDDFLSRKLGSFAEQVEVCDKAGHVLGYFVSKEEHEKLLYAWAQTQFSDLEIEKARNQPGGYSLAEVLESLGR